MSVLSGSLEENNLPVASTDGYLISLDSLNRSDSEGADVLVESDALVLNLEADEVSGRCTCVEEVLVVQTEGHAGVLSNHGAGRDEFVADLSKSGV